MKLLYKDGKYFKESGKFITPAPVLENGVGYILNSELSNKDGFVSTGNPYAYTEATGGAAIDLTLSENSLGNIYDFTQNKYKMSQQAFYVWYNPIYFHQTTSDAVRYRDEPEFIRWFLKNSKRTDRITMSGTYYFLSTPNNLHALNYSWGSITTPFTLKYAGGKNVACTSISSIVSGNNVYTTKFYNSEGIVMETLTVAVNNDASFTAEWSSDVSPSSIVFDNIIAYSADTAQLYMGLTLMTSRTSYVPIMDAGKTWYKGTTKKSVITEIEFKDTYTPVETVVEEWDANVDNTGSIKCYIEDTKLTIVGNGTGKIIANENLSNAFYGFTNVISISGMEALDTSQVTDMSKMFYACNVLTSLDLSNFDTSNVTNMSDMFGGCYKLTSLDLSNFDTSKVTDMNGMFSGCKALTSLNISNFNTSNVTNMGWMFSGCKALTSLNISNFNTSKVTNMNSMFKGCYGFVSLDLSNFNTSNVTEMYDMFYNCHTLTSLNISNFDTSNVTSMYEMFSYCNALTSLDLSNFNTSNVTNMGWMFSYCYELTNLDISNFNTSKVTDMNNMFRDCRSITILDISNFDTSKVTSMTLMFYNCLKLVTIYASEYWATTNVVYSSDMFTYCSKLSGAISYNYSNKDATYANYTTGYLTYKAHS